MVYAGRVALLLALIRWTWIFIAHPAGRHRVVISARHQHPVS
jgi:hypothetical protein